MVHQVREKTIENLKGCINLNILLLIDEHEEQVKQVLPHKVLLLIYGTTDFNKQVANFVDDILVIALTDGF
jgi:hypothetical protein